MQFLSLVRALTFSTYLCSSEQSPALAPLSHTHLSQASALPSLDCFALLIQGKNRLRPAQRQKANGKRAPEGQEEAAAASRSRPRHPWGQASSLGAPRSEIHSWK